MVKITIETAVNILWENDHSQCSNIIIYSACQPILENRMPRMLRYTSGNFVRVEA